MDEPELREWIERVGRGALSRRTFLETVVGLGLTGPMARRLLGGAGLAHAQTKPAFTPARRGGGGPVRTLWWQAPVLLNAHLSPGTKDTDASRIFYEPLANFDPDGNLALVRASESEMDPVKRAALFFRMNDLLIQSVVVIPVLWRGRVAAVSTRLRNAELSPWESDFWNHAVWYREA